MGEGTAGVGTSTANRTPADQTPRARAETLGSEIAVVRDELDRLVAELDRRRHNAFDVRRQLGRHAFGLTLTGLAGRLRQAVVRMTEHPERVAAEPTMAGKIVTAAASAAVAALVKKLLESATRHLLDEGPGVIGAPPPLAERSDQQIARRRASWG